MTPYIDVTWPSLLVAAALFSANLVLSAVRDFFSIVGARATYQEARKVYGVFGAEDKIAMSEVDRGHGYHQPNRLAAYDWFARWLKDGRYSGGEPETEVLEFEDLACTDTGQVATSLGGETVQTLNRYRLESFNPKLPRVTKPGDLAAFRDAIRERAARLSGFERPQNTSACRIRASGSCD